LNKWFYNHRMRQVHFSSLLVTLAMSVAGLAGAQTGPATPVPARSTPSGAALRSDGDSSPSRKNQLIENISVEDGGARIEEHRFGGETRSITVQPKGGMPAYDVQPATGARTWKLLGF
jgi:hypothetical protein